MAEALEPLFTLLKSQALLVKTWLFHNVQGMLLGFGHEAPVVQAAICLTFNCALWCLLVAALRRFASQETATKARESPATTKASNSQVTLPNKDWNGVVPEFKTELSTIEEQPSKEDDREIAARLLQSVWRELQANQEIEKRRQQQKDCTASQENTGKTLKGGTLNAGRGDSKTKRGETGSQSAISNDIYQQALAVAQAKALTSKSISSTTEAKATPQLYSGEASRTALGGRIAKALNSSNTGATTTTHKDCYDLISAFNKDPTAIVDMVAKDATRTIMQKHKEQQLQQKASLKTESSSSSHKLGFQVNTALKLRAQTMASVVIQSWARMIICRRAYLEVFSSLITAPIANLPSTSTSRVGSPTTITTTTQQPIKTSQDPPQSKGSSDSNTDAPSIVSALSSWSSTWNRKKATMVPPTSISTPKAANTAKQTSQQPPPVPDTNESSSSNLLNSASVLQHLPKLWRAATTCDSHNDTTTDTPPKAQTTDSKPQDPKPSDFMDDDDSVVEEDANFVKRFEARRRRTKPGNYYSGLWQSTLERVGECNTMCEALEERSATAVKCHKNSPATSVLSCQNTVVCSDEDSNHYEVVLTSPTGEGMVGCHGSFIPSLCAMPRRSSRQNVTRPSTSTPPAPPTTTTSQANTEKAENKAPPLSEGHKKTQGGLRCNNPGIYYVPTATSADYAVGEDANLFSFSTRTQTTFSSPSTYEEDDQWTAQHQETTSKGLTFAFCTAPPVTTSSSSDSGISTTHSDYYSVDHSASLDEGPSLSYQPSHSIVAGPTNSIDAGA